MIAKIGFLLITAIFMITVAQLTSKAGNCPLKNSVTKCTPFCTTDNQCSGNEKCCPNKCGISSCVSPGAVFTGDDEGGYKGSSQDSVKCNGSYCNKYEKCEFDRKTKQDKCVRT